MKNKKYSFGILFVSILLLMSSVLAETWYYRDDELVGSTSGKIFDYDDKYALLNNASFANNISVDGRVLDNTDFNSWDAFDYSGYDQDLNSTNNVEFSQVTTGSVVRNSTHDNINTFIRNSNGKYWAATGANIQNAIDDLNNESGWVELPPCDIELTSPIDLGDGCWLRGAGNASILRLADDANCTMLRNYDRTNGNVFIRVSDIKLEGNSLGQDVWGGSPNPPYDPFFSYTHGVYLEKCTDCEIYGITTNDTQDCGVFAGHCERINTHDCFFHNSGIAFDGVSTFEHYTAAGIYYYNTSDSIINDLIIDNPYSAGVIIEGEYAEYPHGTNSVSVSDCVVTNTGCGYYTEDALHCVFDNCVVSCNQNNMCWSPYTVGSSGFKIRGTCSDITLSNCIMTDSYWGIDIAIGSKYITMTGCEINNTANKGMLVACTDSLISYNTIADVGHWAIHLQSGAAKNDFSHNIITNVPGGYDALYDQGNNNTISFNFFTDLGHWDAAIRIASASDETVVYNTIIGIGGSYPNIGINGANTDTDCIVMFNKFQNVQNEIYQCNARVNCTDYDDWNFYSGVS